MEYEFTNILLYKQYSLMGWIFLSCFLQEIYVLAVVHLYHVRKYDKLVTLNNK